jgi:type IV pilus assembly protein PilE
MNTKQSLRGQLARSGWRRAAGFSLIELLVVIAIMAILATISVASYRKYALRANRTEARMALLSVQTAQEKFFLQKNAYAQDIATVIAAPPDGLGVALDSTGKTSGGHYTLKFTAAAADSYTLQATATGTQTSDDSACQTFSVNEQGVLTPAATDACWH